MITINSIVIHVDVDNLGDMDGFDQEASISRYCDQLRDAVAQEFPGADIEITIGGYSPIPYAAYVGDVPAPESVEHRLRDLANDVFAANQWQVSA